MSPWQQEQARRQDIRDKAMANFLPKGKEKRGHVQFNTHHSRYEYIDHHGRAHNLAPELIEMNEEELSRKRAIEDSARALSRRLFGGGR